jgi:hypothetical protein
MNISLMMIGLSILCFIIAVITAFTGEITGFSPESFSRACSNLALISIALVIWLIRVKSDITTTFNKR